MIQADTGKVAVVGDQLFTDILGGNRNGMYTILVTPISKQEFIGTKNCPLFEPFCQQDKRHKLGPRYLGVVAVESLLQQLKTAYQETKKDGKRQVLQILFLTGKRENSVSCLKHEQI